MAHSYDLGPATECHSWDRRSWTVISAPCVCPLKSLLEGADHEVDDGERSFGNEGDKAFGSQLHEVTSIDRDKGKMREESRVPWNMSKALEQLGGDESLFQEVIDIFLDQAPKHLAVLRVAVEQRQAETVETTAHTLKGDLGYLGIPEISQRAREIEEVARSKDVSRVASLLPQFEADINGLFSEIRSAKALGWNRM